MPIPSFFQAYARNFREDDYAVFEIADSDGTEFFEIWYYGELYYVGGEPEPYIVAHEDGPALVVARNPQNGHNIVLFDGTSFGYDNMFCDVYTAEQIEHRPLQKLDMLLVKVTVTLGYSIDYEDEKDEYNVDGDGNVELIDGRVIPWAQVISDGFDYLNLKVTDATGNTREIGDVELA